MNEQTQALLFFKRVQTQFFYVTKLLTTGNPEADKAWPCSQI